MSAYLQTSITFYKCEISSILSSNDGIRLIEGTLFLWTLSTL